MGEAAVAAPEPGRFEGCRLGATIAPAKVDDLAAALAVCTRHALPVLVRGGGTRLGLGNPPRAARAWLSTAALEPCCEVDAGEGVARVSAATPLRALDAAAREAGWRSPLEAAGADATVGGALATAAAGPRRTGLGPPRRAALGLEVVLAGGERTRCGSRVVKNVTGYDLVKLHVGAFGTLGVLTEAWIRLRPRPEAERTLVARAGEDGPALALAAARRAGAHAVALVDGALADGLGAPGTGNALVVALAGDAPVVEDGEAWLRERADAAESADAVGRLADREADPEAGALRLRIAAPAPALGQLRARLRDAGARTILDPGRACARAFFALERPDAALADAAWRAARTAAAAAGGHAVLEHAPDWAKVGRDVFDAAPATLPLMRALKREFDPAGVLNPGRFAGGL